MSGPVEIRGQPLKIKDYKMERRIRDQRTKRVKKFVHDSADDVKIALRKFGYDHLHLKKKHKEKGLKPNDAKLSDTSKIKLSKTQKIKNLTASSQYAFRYAVDVPGTGFLGKFFGGPKEIMAMFVWYLRSTGRVSRIQIDYYPWTPHELVKKAVDTIYSREKSFLRDQNYFARPINGGDKEGNHYAIKTLLVNQPANYD